MEELKAMKQQLMAAAQSQMGNLENANAKELGEVIDMIKDIDEAIYYCSIVKAMEKSEKDEDNNALASSLLATWDRTRNSEQRYYTPYLYPSWEDPRYVREGDYSRTRYYDGGQSVERHNSREGNSGIARRGYIEDKEMHVAKEKQIQDLEKYMQELTKDIIDMIHDATPDEKALLQQKLTTLATKITNV